MWTITEDILDLRKLTEDLNRYSNERAVTRTNADEEWTGGQMNALTNERMKKTNERTYVREMIGAGEQTRTRTDEHTNSEQTEIATFDHSNDVYL